MRKLILSAGILMSALITFGQGTETFTAIGGGSSSSYSSRTWTGDDGSTWNATNSRTDQTINGDALTLNDDTADTFAESGTITGGVGDITISTQRKFSGGSGNLNVLVNGNVVGTVPYGTDVTTTTITGVNVPGDVVIRVNNNIGGSNSGGADRVAIDDLTWTAFAGMGTPDVRFLNVDAGAGQFTLRNFGTDTQDLSDWWLCSLFVYDQIDASNQVNSGDDLMLAPGEEIVLSWVEINALNRDLGLYNTNSFSSSTAIEDFLQWGAANQGRASVAETAGLWTASEFLDGLAPYSYVGNGDPDNGLAFWETTPCYVIDGSDIDNEFEIVDIQSNSQMDTWLLNGTSYEVNGFTGTTGETTESWLIFGALLTGGATTLDLGFDLIEGFDGGTSSELNFFWSNDFTGCPDNATWTQVGANFLGDGDDDALDQILDFSGALASTGEFYLGVQYISGSGGGEASAVTLSNIFLTGDNCVLKNTPLIDCGPVCELIVNSTMATCDDETAGTDTYSVDIDYSGGNTGQMYTVTPSTGMVGGDNPNTTADGIITITGINEGTDLMVTIATADMACDETVMITSPICEPFNPPAVRINELDTDTPGTDAEEFIELRGPANQSLDGFILVLYNGSDDRSYNTPIDLNGFTIPDDGDGFGYFVIGSASVPNVDLVAFTTNGLQNGADGVGLYFNRLASEFPNDTPISLTNLVDGLAYDTNDADDPALAVLNLEPDPEAQINEDENGNRENESIQRGSWLVGAPTPGATSITALPVELASFSAELGENSNVELNWTTASEDNNSHFEVQHSTDGITWVEIGEVTGAGTTSTPQAYSFTDDTPATGTNLYRLRQVDFDGDAEFSDVLAVEVGSELKVTSYNGSRIEVFTPERGALNVSIYNALGQVVRFENQTATRGNNSIDASDLNTGIYFIRFEINGKQTVYKIVR